MPKSDRGVSSVRALFAAGLNAGAVLYAPGGTLGPRVQRDYGYDHFAQDFGGLRPSIVREAQWYTTKNTPTSPVLRTEGLVGWGAAPFGFNPDPRFTVADVGPGFNNALFTNRFHGQPGGVITDRRGGQYYTENLEQALASGRRLLAIETWNELCEASGIQETVEYGRQYIAITRQYADRLKAKYPPPPGLSAQ